MSIIKKLTEGIINRNVQKEGQAMLDKWEKTGLLEGIESDHSRSTMACLLENQAKELLREASSMAAGDVEGFAAVAFPIVRRVFGGLIANELVSVQPMSLPSGLIFFLDFTHNGDKLGNEKNKSVYGGTVVGSQITGGVDLGTLSGSQAGFYGLNNGYSAATASVAVTLHQLASGTFGGTGLNVGGSGEPTTGFGRQTKTDTDSGDLYLNGIGIDVQEDFDKLCRHDPDFISGTTTVAIVGMVTASTVMGTTNNFNFDDLVACSLRDVDNTDKPLSPGGGVVVRRLTTVSGSNSGLFQDGDTQLNKGATVLFLAASKDGSVAPRTMMSSAFGAATLHYPIKDNLTTSDAVGSVVGAASWGLENTVSIPEIDIKVDSVSITSNTKKLKAKWTPELQQDINAYHNMDAEVELTSILSETIALEIDQEILADLITGAKAGTYYWSRRPGKFVRRDTGGLVNQSLFPDFTGTVSEWYETCLEVINDISAAIHRKVLRGGANFLVVSPEVANMLEFTSGFRADTTADENKGTAGAVKVGSISKKWDVYVDPYFPRNVILVGRKGNSFLESGYVYAPYVPLQVTPTIFDPDSFVPRKGVMTRYGKKMVRPDMYGLVIVEDMLG